MTTNTSSRAKVARSKPALAALSLTILSLASLTANAQIVSYVVTGANAGSSSTIAASGANAGVSASSLSVGAGINNPLNQVNSFAWRSWSASATYVSGSTTYFEFSIAPQAGFTVDFSTIDYGVWRGSLATAPHAFDLRASTDNFSTSDVLLGSHAPGVNTVSTFSDSAAGLGTINAGTTITFRLFGYNGNGSAGGFANGTAGVTGGSDLTINGTVSAVPEPSTYAGVFGLLALGYVCANRRLSKV